MATLDCNNPALARSLNPTRCFNCFYENDLKSGIIDDDSKDTGQEGFDADDAQSLAEYLLYVFSQMTKTVGQLVNRHGGPPFLVELGTSMRNDIVIFQQLFANFEIACLNLGLSFFNSLVNPWMHNGLAFFKAKL